MRQHLMGWSRLVQAEEHLLRPTIIACESMDHPLANREFLCPYASVVELLEKMLDLIGPTLVVSAITKDQALFNFCWIPDRAVKYWTHSDYENILGPTSRRKSFEFYTSVDPSAWL